MSSVFDGEIVVPGEAGDGLTGTVVLDNGSITLSAGDEILGSWDAPDYQVRRGENGGFRLTLGGEDLLFWPELPKSFAEATGAPVKAQPTQLPPVEEPLADDLAAAVEPTSAPAEAPSAVKGDPGDGTVDDIESTVRPLMQLEDVDELVTPGFLRAIVAVAAVIVAAALLAIVFL